MMAVKSKENDWRLEPSTFRSKGEAFPFKRNRSFFENRLIDCKKTFLFLKIHFAKGLLLELKPSAISINPLSSKFSGRIRCDHRLRIGDSLRWKHHRKAQRQKRCYRNF